MNRYTLFILLLGLLALLSCRELSSERQMLDSIEQTWQQAEKSPSEAQVRAEGMRDSVRKSSELVRQQYNLLTIRLRDKRNCIPSSPDSALQTASYFEKRKNDACRERAYFYLGSAYRDLKDYPRAVRHFLRAVDIAKESDCADTLIWQNALSQLRYLYMLQLNYEEELNMALQAVALAKQSGKNLGWYLMDAASAYRNLNDTLLCFKYCDMAYETIRQEHFPAKYANVLAGMLATYSIYNHYDKVDTLLRRLKQLPEQQRPYNYELGLALFYEHGGRRDSAILHYQTYLGREKNLSGRYEASSGLQRCYYQVGDFQKAAEWGLRLYDTNDSIISGRAFEATQRARDTYIYYRDKEKERAIVQRDERIILFSVIAGLTLLSIVLGLLALYTYRKKRLMEKIIDKDQELRSALDELKQGKKINRTLTQIALMNKAADEAKAVVAQFHKAAIGQTKLEEESWKDLMSAIEALYPGFLEAVQKRLQGNLREPLLRTICLLKIGMKPMQIGYVMDAKKQTVWNRIKRAEETCGDLIGIRE